MRERILTADGDTPSKQFHRRLSYVIGLLWLANTFIKFFTRCNTALNLHQKFGLVPVTLHFEGTFV